MHPLCCISLESPGGSIRDQSPEPPLSASLLRARSLPATATAGGSDGNAGRSEATVAGVLYKWTNYGKGWRSRWFRLRNGVLSYTKIRRTENLNLLMSPASDDVTLIGEISANRLSRLDSSGRRKHHQKTVGIVHLKVQFYHRSNRCVLHRDIPIVFVSIWKFFFSFTRIWFDQKKAKKKQKEYEWKQGLDNRASYKFKNQWFLALFAMFLWLSLFVGVC